MRACFWIIISCNLACTAVLVK
uniref:Anx2 n=1 Tax=Arundo donax TaxID=35708 RepID=A0A0A9E8H6_ARUDO